MADLLSGLIAKAREVQAQDAKLDNTSRILGLPVEHYTDEEKLALAAAANGASRKFGSSDPRTPWVTA